MLMNLEINKVCTRIEEDLASMSGMTNDISSAPTAFRCQRKDRKPVTQTVTPYLGPGNQATAAVEGV